MRVETYVVAAFRLTENCDDSIKLQKNSTESHFISICSSINSEVIILLAIDVVVKSTENT
jgi:hypothetical protein